MKPYANNWQDFPDYIIGITKQIWEDRGIESLNHYYAPDIVVRSPMGIQRGNETVKASTMTTIHEFPDRQLFGEDVIWSETPENGHLSSHRLITILRYSSNYWVNSSRNCKYKLDKHTPGRFEYYSPSDTNKAIAKS